MPIISRQLLGFAPGCRDDVDRLHRVVEIAQPIEAIDMARQPIRFR
jgi:hypothetical protein